MLHDVRLKTARQGLGCTGARREVQASARELRNEMRTL